MNNKYIGVFDSGVGGLTVVKEIMDVLPNENIIYFGDTKNLPYGDHTKEELINLVTNDVKLLNNFDIKVITIACNTSDSVFNEDIKKHSNVPIIGIIKPTCLKAIKETKNKKIGVLATKATIDSKIYELNIKEIDPSVEVISMSCPKFVPLIENEANKKDLIQAIHEYTDPLVNFGVDTIILGCTHYPLLKDLISNITKDINLISSSSCLVNSLKDFLIETDNLSDNRNIDYRFLVSKDSKLFKKKAKKLINKEIEVEEYYL